MKNTKGTTSAMLTCKALTLMFYAEIGSLMQSQRLDNSFPSAVLLPANQCGRRCSQREFVPGCGVGPACAFQNYIQGAVELPS